MDDINTYRHGCVTLIENRIQVQYKLFALLEKTSTGGTFQGDFVKFRLKMITQCINK